MANMRDGFYYEQPNLWGNPPDRYQVQDRADILDLLPDDAGSVLDVGCGDGFITNELPQHLRVVGLDISAEALRYVKRQGVAGSILNLPFGENSFDLVMANDVIEHIPDALHPQALSELARVAAKYILITVPHHEQLDANQTKCADCGTVYHIHWHQRSYTTEMMHNLFRPPVVPVEIRFSGDTTLPLPDPTVAARHHLGIYHRWEQALCPNCGSQAQAEPSQSALVSRAVDVQRCVYWFARPLSPQRWSNRSEIIGFYSKGPRPRQGNTPAAYPEVSRTWLHVDFSNPLQVASPDFVAGVAWAKFTLPAGAQQSDEGVRRSPAAPDPALIPVRLPIQVHAGDRLRLAVSGKNTGGTITLYALDGLQATRSQLLDTPVNGPRQSYEFVIDQPWWPDRWGTALEVQLRGEVTVHELQYTPAQGELPVTPFILLKPGHHVLRRSTRGPILSWGLLVNATGRFPKPDLEVSGPFVDEAVGATEVLAAVLALAEQARLDQERRGEQLSRLLEETEASRHKAEQAATSLERQYRELAKHFDSLSRHTEQIEKMREAAERSCQIIEQRCEALSEQLGRTDQELTATRQRCEEVEKAYLALEGEYTARGEQLASLTGRLEEMRHESEVLLGQWEATRAALEQARRELVERLEQKEQQRDAAEKAYANLQREYNSIAAELGLRRGVRGGLKEAARSLKRRLVGPPMSVPHPIFLAPWKPFAPAAQPPDRRLKVLVISHMFPHPDQPSSGPFIHEQVRALRQFGDIDARVLVGRPFWMPRRNPVAFLRAERCYRRFHDACAWLDLEGVPVLYLPYRVFGPFFTHGLSYRASIRRAIDAVRQHFPFELVHAHTCYLDGSAGLAVARRFGVPLVITEHTGPFSYLAAKPIVRHYALKALRRADRVISVSTAQERAVAEHLAPRHHRKMTVLPNVVDTELFYPSADGRADPGAPRILFVGYFVPVKNLSLLLEAFSIVRRDLPGAHLRLIGGGEVEQQQKDLAETVRCMGLEQNVVVEGYQPRANIARIMREECDLLVLCSRAETFGCVLTEAMACGKPVVATRCGGPEDIVTEPFLGTLCPSNDAGELARAILQVASGLEAYMPEDIRRHAEVHFGGQSVARRLANLYRECKMR